MELSGQSHNSISFPARIIIVDSFMKIAMKHGPNDKLLNLTIWIASPDPMTMARLRPGCFCWLFSNQLIVFFSHTKSAPTASQPTVIFSHNKPDPATSRNQKNRGMGLGLVLPNMPVEKLHFTSLKFGLSLHFLLDNETVYLDFSISRYQTCDLFSVFFFPFLLCLFWLNL